MSECDYLFLNILLIGSKGTGRTTLRNNHMSCVFKSHMKSTIGVDFYSKTVTLKNSKRVRLGFWDLADNGYFDHLKPHYYHGAPAAIILYDITNKSSLRDLSKWCQEIREYSGNIPILLVGNKLDLPEQREISAEYISQLKEQYMLMQTLEISAKTGENVEEMFSILTNLIMKNLNLE
jgi:small GTP-binding protein